MIDLSFLTEAEQEAILKVLSRDAELKKSEEERVRHLQDVVDDENELKYKTGQWFYEAKSKRHRDKIHGADLVRASIRKRKQPSTIAELSKGSLDPSKKSWVNNVKGLFIPPELYGVMEEPEEDLEALQQTKAQANQSAKRVSFLPTDNKENLVNGTASPAKIRKNPFNANLEEIGTERSQVKQNQPPENGTGPNAEPEPLYAVVKKIPKQDLPEDKKPEIEVSKPISVDPKQGLEDPVLSALARSAAKAVLKDQLKPDIPKEDIVLSDKEVPTENSLQENAEKLKRLSQSVPAFLDNETDGRDTDSASESSFQIGRHKKSPSSLTNLSGSSGMASLSSVSGSVMSVYSGDFGNVDIKGNIQFAVDYVEQSREFNVFVCQCKDLAVADLKRQRSDPYVKSYLLPDKAKMGKRKSAVKRKTLNPTYNEVLRYKIDKPTLLNQTLNLSVWHNDPLGRNSFLGEVDIVLATWDWDNKEMNWYPLQPRTPSSGIGLENRGETKLALKYIPEMSPGIKLPITGEVHIWIKECNQLPMLRGNKINSFVKCTILPDTSRKSRQKTRTVDRTPNPVFNHTMVYDGFKEEDLREACVELTVWDHNRLTNHFLGGLRIGLGTGKSYGTAVDWMDSNIEESTMWEKMINTPNTWIEGVLPLRMLRMAKLIK